MKRKGFKKNGKYYVIVEGKNVEVEEEVYYAFMRPEWREEKRQQREWRCRDGKGHRCNKNCEECEIYRLGKGPTGSVLSLDQMFEEDGYEAKGSKGHADIVLLKMALDSLLEELREMVPDADRIVDMIRDEEMIKDVAKELDVPPTTLKSRKDKVHDFLEKHLKDFR